MESRRNGPQLSSRHDDDDDDYDPQTDYLSLAIPLWVGAIYMSTSESWDLIYVNRHTARCTSAVYLWTCSVSWRLTEISAAVWGLVAREGLHT